MQDTALRLQSKQSASDSIHIVRRYGLSGGLERYVWEVTQRLAKRGHKVIVICEAVTHTLPEFSGKEHLRIISVGWVNPHRPRWISQWRFARRVENKLRDLKTNQFAIHSHERSTNHDISTIHGPSIRSRRLKPGDRFSPRLQVWERMEHSEVAGDSVKMVFPVSDDARASYLNIYPEIAGRMQQPAYPAVSETMFPFKYHRKDVTNTFTFGFLGHEWRRKGLDLLAVAFNTLIRQGRDVALIVAGCEPDQVRHLFAESASRVTFVEWIEPEDFYRQIDALVLPARVEPFGMVVAEANACGLPVVVSSASGISKFVEQRHGIVVDIMNRSALLQACERILDWDKPVKRLALNWDRTVSKYAAAYATVLSLKNGSGPDSERDTKFFSREAGSDNQNHVDKLKNSGRGTEIHSVFTVT